MQTSHEDVVTLTALVMDELGIEDIDITVSTRRTEYRLATTWARQQRITIYSRLMLNYPLDAVEDVIRHEAAHVVEYRRHGSTGHGMRWRGIATELGALPRANSNPGERASYRRGEQEGWTG